MAGEKLPLISILMAVYEPRLDWLAEQLRSIRDQTYPNLRLYIVDDGSAGVSEAELRRCATQCLSAVPWTLGHTEENRGSNAVFAALTAAAEGEYFAYCDQDDVWLPEKLSVLYDTLRREKAVLVCSDQAVIDENGKELADSITQIRRHHLFRSGDDLWKTLWYSNFASGSAMMVRADAAKSALPLDPYMYYDHYIALCASERGRIVSVPAALVRHREHGGNQSSLLRGVENKASYYRIRVENKLAAVDWLCRYHQGPPELMETLETARRWLEARSRYAKGDRRQAWEIWRHRSFSPRPAMLELAMPFLPERAFRKCVDLARENKL